MVVYKVVQKYGGDSFCSHPSLRSSGKKFSIKYKLKEKVLPEYGPVFVYKRYRHAKWLLLQLKFYGIYDATIIAGVSNSLTKLKDSKVSGARGRTKVTPTEYICTGFKPIKEVVVTNDKYRRN